MYATTFDSLAVARKLKAAGVEENQAELLAESMREASAANREDLATKADIAALEAQIKAVEVQLRSEIASAVNRMTFTMLVALSVLFAALKLF